MKPRRLSILITVLVLVGIMLAFDGYMTTGGFGTWTSGSLACFFAAHLLSIPHNSGRFWSAFIVLGMFATSAVKFASYFEFAGFQRTHDLPVLIALGVPMLYLMTGFLILVLSLHSTVCDYFDSIERPRPRSIRQKQQAEQGGDGDAEKAV